MSLADASLPPHLIEVKQALEAMGSSPEALASTLSDIDENVATHALIVEWRSRIESHLQSKGTSLTSGALERLLLATAAQASDARIDALPVSASVKRLIRDEFASWLKPGRTGPDAGTGTFSSAAKIATLRRFPAGPMDWEMAGVPRSWLAKVPRRDLPRILACIAQMGGFRPLLHMHVGSRPRNRSLVIEKEVLRSYYRMVRSMELQPGVRGVMGVAWFYDPRAVEQNPHLAFLNAPFREPGGFITDIGEAPLDSGFAEHNPGRGDLYKSGKLQYRLGLALLPRASAIEWARSRPDLDS